MPLSNAAKTAVSRKVRTKVDRINKLSNAKLLRFTFVNVKIVIKVNFLTPEDMFMLFLSLTLFFSTGHEQAKGKCREESQEKGK